MLALGGAKNHIILLPDANPELSGTGISDSFTGCAVNGAWPPVSCSRWEIVSSYRANSAACFVVGAGPRYGSFNHQGASGILERGHRAGREGRRKTFARCRKAKAPAGFEGGNWLGPTILDHVQPGSEAATVELFGPVLSIVHCKDLSEAMRLKTQLSTATPAAFLPRVVRWRRELCAKLQPNGGSECRECRCRASLLLWRHQCFKIWSWRHYGTSFFGFLSNVKKVTTKWKNKTTQLGCLKKQRANSPRQAQFAYHFGFARQSEIQRDSPIHWGAKTAKERGRSLPHSRMRRRAMPSAHTAGVTRFTERCRSLRASFRPLTSRT